jgi:hypothetical protein
MNKTVEVLYDEYIESYDPRAMLSKLKKSELIDLLVYAQDEECIDIENLKQWMECRTNEVVIELLPKLLEEYAREMNQAKQMQDKKMYA